MVNFSLEYFPPGDQAGLKNLSNQARVMSAYSPLYMSITHSAKGAELNETMHAVQILKEQLSVEISPHMTCSSYSQAEIIKMAADYLSLGVESVVALRGNLIEDANKSEPRYDNSPDFINALSKKFDFRISISAYPEGHPEKKDDASDLKYLRKKCDAGADEIITQWFFSNDYLLQLEISVMPPVSIFQLFLAFCQSVILRRLRILRKPVDQRSLTSWKKHFSKLMMTWKQLKNWASIMRFNK